MISSKKIKGRNILITAGSTWVAIDAVRVITNIFGGALGTEIATEGVRQGAKVTLLLGPGRINPKSLDKKIKVIPYKYYSDLLTLVKKHVSSKKYDIIIHSAAVADYIPEKPHSGKIKSNLDTLIIKLKKTKKIVDLVKKLDPDIFLVKFKLEVGKSKDELLSIAKESMDTSHADMIVANDFQKMKHSHVAFILDKRGNVLVCKSKKATAKKLLEMLSKV